MPTAVMAQTIDPERSALEGDTISYLIVGISGQEPEILWSSDVPGQAGEDHDELLRSYLESNGIDFTARLQSDDWFRCILSPDVQYYPWLGAVEGAAVTYCQGPGIREIEVTSSLRVARSRWFDRVVASATESTRGNSILVTAEKYCDSGSTQTKWRNRNVTVFRWRSGGSITLPYQETTWRTYTCAP